MTPKTGKALLKEMTITRPGRKQLCNLRDVIAWQPDRLLPTPTTKGGNRKLDAHGRNINSQGIHFGVSLEQLARAGLLPHPEDHQPPNPEDAASQQAPTARPGTLKAHGRDSQLNPQFVGEMMGFPPGWTTSPFQNGAGNASEAMVTP
ncbi:hypothetical protein [Paraflavitalea devenefica]|uniref:hypothetical protein n=1 Tax=Paraflavitalea devenefica TaxID=2716334 RepID=UPI001421A4BF|nr:hypothetical protein [Paraflavitalea devenefica]